MAGGVDFSTLNSSIAVPPRYLFSMAREGAMPKVFAKLHPKYGTPWVAILVLGVLSLILVKYPITFVASVSLFADLFYYIIGIAAAWGLRKKHPELHRPFKAPCMAVGVPISMVIYFIMLTQLDQDAIVSGIIWCVVGLIIYAFCRRKYGDADLKVEDVAAGNEVPSVKEKQAMDKDYHLWKGITMGFFVLSILLYVIPLL